jgi:hypothetical protein
MGDESTERRFERLEDELDRFKETNSQEHEQMRNRLTVVEVKGEGREKNANRAVTASITLAISIIASVLSVLIAGGHL